MKTSPELRLLADALGALATTMTGIIDTRVSQALEQRRAELETKLVPPKPMEVWVNRKAAAAHFQVSERTLGSWMRQRKVPYMKLERSVRFKLSDVEAALKRRFQPMES